MAITPLSNSTFVSQNAAVASTQVANERGKESFAALANLAEFQGKDKSVERIDKATPADEVQEEIKDKREEESSKRRKKDDKDEKQKRKMAQSSEDNELGLHSLDISI